MHSRFHDSTRLVYGIKDIKKIYIKNTHARKQVHEYIYMKNKANFKSSYFKELHALDI